MLSNQKLFTPVRSQSTNNSRKNTSRKNSGSQRSAPGTVIKDATVALANTSFEHQIDEAKRKLEQLPDDPKMKRAHLKNILGSFDELKELLSTIEHEGGEPEQIKKETSGRPPLAKKGKKNVNRSHSKSQYSICQTYKTNLPPGDGQRLELLKRQYQLYKKRVSALEKKVTQDYSDQQLHVCSREASQLKHENERLRLDIKCKKSQLNQLESQLRKTADQDARTKDKYKTAEKEYERLSGDVEHLDDDEFKLKSVSLVQELHFSMFRELAYQVAMNEEIVAELSDDAYEVELEPGDYEAVVTALEDCLDRRTQLGAREVSMKKETSETQTYMDQLDRSIQNIRITETALLEEEDDEDEDDLLQE